MGYEFLGWFTAKEQGEKLTEYSQVDKNRTYFAHWKKLKEYLVTFDANGGEGGWSNWMYIGYPITAPEVTFGGYTFGGWLPDVDEVVPDHNVTYVAQWDSNVYRVTFMANGGTVSTRAKLVEHNAEIGGLPTPERTGYESRGWWTDAEGGTQISSSTKITSNKTYYAHWGIKTFTATFNANGGTGGTTKT